MVVHKNFRNTLVALVGLVYAIHGLASGEAKARTVSTKSSCINCHTDFTSVLRNGHPPVTGKEITACLVCHVPKITGKPELNAFSAGFIVLTNVLNKMLIVSSAIPGNRRGVLAFPSRIGQWGSHPKRIWTFLSRSSTPGLHLFFLMLFMQKRIRHVRVVMEIFYQSVKLL